jgi:hypothetical protein
MSLVLDDGAPASRWGQVSAMQNSFILSPVRGFAQTSFPVTVV